MTGMQVAPVPTGPQRVVLVDDYEAANRGRRDWLVEGGHEVIATLDFEHAIVFRGYDRATLVVLDAHDERDDAQRAAAARAAGVPANEDRLPGWRVIRAIREIRPKGTLRVVVASAYATSAVLQQELWEIGADELIQPADVHDVSEFLDMVTGRRRGRAPNKPERIRLEAAYNAALEPRQHVHVKQTGEVRLIAAITRLDEASEEVRRQMLTDLRVTEDPSSHRQRDAFTEAVTDDLDLMPTSQKHKTVGTPRLRRIFRVLLGLEARSAACPACGKFADIAHECPAK